MKDDVRAWLAHNTSTSQRWCRHLLAALKGDTTVTVVLPARDEAATIGAIVAGLRRELMERVHLVDEVVVVDSGSRDQTAAVARRAGASVVAQSAVLPHLGDRPGKGEALWKSLMVTQGDIVAFIDADLREFDPQFAVGLVGPLLTDPRIGFVKALYDRPLANGQEILPAGGGRVTELVARPLLNLHWPALAGFVQPLAGEYAGRRTVFERVPFLSGYGVEIAMLIDILEGFGLESMGQVDLGSRRHRNSDDAALGRMAAQVHLAVLSRMHRHGHALMAAEPSMRLTQFVRRGTSFEPETNDVAVTERPPMLEVEEYRRRLVGDSACP